MSSQGTKLASTILSYLKKAKLLKVLPELIDALKSSREYQQSQHQVTVTSAIKLTTVDLNKIEAYIKRTIGSSYVLTTLVDPTLVAGFTLQIDDTLTDASLLGKMIKLQSTLNTKD